MKEEKRPKTLEGRVTFLETQLKLKEQLLSKEEIEAKINGLTKQRQDLESELQQIAEEEQPRRDEIWQQIDLINAELQAYEQALAALVAGLTQPGVSGEEGKAKETATEQQGGQEPEKDEHGCVVGKELWDPDQEKCVAITTEQQGDQEPEKDEHGCVIGKERWDPDQEKCVPIATEQQGDQEPEKDEHGCVIGKERWDPDHEKCVPIATEEKKKGLGEAIIESETEEQPTLVVPVEKLEAKLPPLQAERSMDWGAQRFVQDVKRLIREAKEESQSG